MDKFQPNFAIVSHCSILLTSINVYQHTQTQVLSDPHKRETYDAIGERGMKWIEEPFSLDPQELAHNFATSSVLDRWQNICDFCWALLWQFFYCHFVFAFKWTAYSVPMPSGRQYFSPCGFGMQSFCFIIPVSL
jgi:curved DNA-binding protein CbpA